MIAGQPRVLREGSTDGTVTAHFRLADDAVATATALGFAPPSVPVVLAVAIPAWWWRGPRVTPAA